MEPPSDSRVGKLLIKEDLKTKCEIDQTQQNVDSSIKWLHQLQLNLRLNNIHMYVEHLIFIFNYVSWGQVHVKQTEPQILCLVFKAISGQGRNWLRQRNCPNQKALVCNIFLYERLHVPLSV